MAGRPLRQFYGEERTFTIEGLPPPAAAFRRHRARFLEALRALTGDEWSATTRCDAWNAKDVCNHLVTADGFWVFTLQARHAAERTTVLRGFDPAVSPGTIVAPMRDLEPAAVLDGLEASTVQLGDALAAVTDDEWALRSESPLGHVPLAAIAAHSLWDSWLHERDIVGPLGRLQREPEADELVTAVAFTLFLGGTQGGVLDDPDAVADGPDEPVDATVAFDDLPGRTFRLEVDRDVRVAVLPHDVATTTTVGSAVTFVEAVAGRAPMEPTGRRVPADLAAQLDRARRIL